MYICVYMYVYVYTCSQCGSTQPVTYSPFSRRLGRMSTRDLQTRSPPVSGCIRSTCAKWAVWGSSSQAWSRCITPRYAPRRLWSGHCLSVCLVTYMYVRVSFMHVCLFIHVRLMCVCVHVCVHKRVSMYLRKICCVCMCVCCVCMCLCIHAPKQQSGDSYLKCKHTCILMRAKQLPVITTHTHTHTPVIMSYLYIFSLYTLVHIRKFSYIHTHAHIHTYMHTYIHMSVGCVCTWWKGLVKTSDGEARNAVAADSACRTHRQV